MTLYSLSSEKANNRDSLVNKILDSPVFNTLSGNIIIVNDLTTDSVTCMGTMSLGTNPLTVGAITSSGSYSGTNGTMTIGTNSMTTGNIQCYDVNCGTNSINALNITGTNASFLTIALASVTMAATSSALVTSTGTAGVLGTTAASQTIDGYR